MKEQANQKKESKKIDVTEVKTEDLEVVEKVEKKVETAGKEKEVEDKKEKKTEEVNEVIKSKKKNKKKRQILKGKANVKCSYNNTIVSLSDLNGNVLAWATSGLLGFKGAKKATPYAATQVVANVAEKVKKYGLKDLEVYVKGVGSGRESSIRALANNGFNLISIKDVTPIPHNGCRARRPRRL